jgi:hypothetical protein
VLSAFTCLVLMSAPTGSRSFEQPHSQERKMTAGSDNENRAVSHSAIWALERLAIRDIAARPPP